MMTQAESIRPESIHSMLRIGRSRIAVGRAVEVAALVLAQPKAFPRLIECLWDDDPATASRAAHALELVSRDGQPGPIAQLNSVKTSLLGLLPEAQENKLRWHLALIVPRLTLGLTECARAAHALEAWLEDRSSSIVKTMALQGLVDLTRQNPDSLARVLDLLRIYGRSGTAAMRARSRLLLEQLEKKSGPEPK
jgi:hypothetical protein